MTTAVEKLDKKQKAYDALRKVVVPLIEASLYEDAGSVNAHGGLAQ